MIRVSIIGAGNLASHLYRTFIHNDEIQLEKIFSRKAGRLSFVQENELKSHSLEELGDPDIIFLAVKDEAIVEVAQKLSIKNGFFVHCSGGNELKVLSEFENHGVFYPLQTFSKDKRIDFRNIPICIEANSEENLQKLKDFASLVSEKVFEVDSEKRRALHLAAVFVNNFTNHLYTIASDFCSENGIPFDILKPLMKETVSKLDTLPPYSAQTGPAIRNDKKTIMAHMEMLNEEHKKIYKLLTASIQKIHGKEL
ncbi:Rossmann-like and DUF2520 domain-containing protein [Gramella sp. AN32]|nr:Rossmann-like and DUF2520 domain-containing protein [Gramella sp. AN32]MCM4156052.1 DUF2520 domain-containing protein [Gramella sp. AN32]